MSRSPSVVSTHSSYSESDFNQSSSFEASQASGMLLQAAHQIDPLAQSWPAPRTQLLAPPQMIRSTSMPAANRPNAGPIASTSYRPKKPLPANFGALGQPYQQQWPTQAAPPPWLQFSHAPFDPRLPTYPFPPADAAVPLPTMNQMTNNNRSYGFPNSELAQSTAYPTFPPHLVQPQASELTYFDSQAQQTSHGHNPYAELFASSLPPSFAAGSGLEVIKPPARPTSAPPPSTTSYDIPLMDEAESQRAMAAMFQQHAPTRAGQLKVERPSRGRAISGHQEEAALQLLALKTGSSSAPNSPEKQLIRKREAEEEQQQQEDGSFDTSGDLTIRGEDEADALDDEDRPKKRAKLLEHVLSSPPPSDLHFGTPSRGQDLFGDLNEKDDSQSAERSTYATGSSPGLSEGKDGMFTSSSHGLATPAHFNFTGQCLRIVAYS